MKSLVMFCLLTFTCGAARGVAQEDAILPAQTEAIRALALEKGFTTQALNDYLIQKWGAPLSKLTRAKASALIRSFQSETPPSPSEILRQEVAVAAGEPKPQTVAITTPPPKATREEKSPPLLIAEYLEVGMSKRFHLIDGNIVMGTLVNLDGGICSIQTEDGVLRIPSGDILEETAEITKRDGSRYVGPVLRESMEEITVRSKYGDVSVGKRDVLDMNRYHGGKLVRWAEERKTFYRGSVVLTDIFSDPTAFPLEPHALYVSALSLGYGFTDYFMVRTAVGNNFSGDLNLQPIFQFYNRRTGATRIAAAVGLDMYSRHDMTTVLAKYSRYVTETRSGKPINEIDAFPVSIALDKSMKKAFYTEIYAVFSQRWNLESGRGEMGYHIGFRTNTLPIVRNSLLADGYEWSKKIFPYRAWVAFEYDLTKDLKLGSVIWADNGYRYRTLQAVINDYLRDTPFILDGVEGEYRTIDFDFGLIYAATSSLSIGVHFKDPYLVLFWRIIEF